MFANWLTLGFFDDVKFKKFWYYCDTFGKWTMQTITNIVNHNYAVFEFFKYRTPVYTSNYTDEVCHHHCYEVSFWYISEVEYWARNSKDIIKTLSYLKALYKYLLLFYESQTFWLRKFLNFV